MAVYTELSHGEIEHFLSFYPLPPLAKAEGICSGVENTNYLITLQGGRKLILTLFEKRVKAEELPFFAGLMEHLASAGVPSPLPLHCKDGNIIQALKGKQAIVVTFLAGESTEHIKDGHIAELGAYLAKLHLAGAGYPLMRRNDLSVEGWRELYVKIAARAHEISPGLEEELHNELIYLEPLWPLLLPKGVIHADLFPDNVFFDRKNHLTGIIDFYFACNDFLAYDLAVCINSWCFDKDFQLNKAHVKLLLEHYSKVRPLTRQELDAMPVLVRGAALRFLLTRAYDFLHAAPGALVSPKDPLEYLRKLRLFRDMKDKLALYTHRK